MNPGLIAGLVMVGSVIFSVTLTRLLLGELWPFRFLSTKRNEENK